MGIVTADGSLEGLAGLADKNLEVLRIMISQASSADLRDVMITGK